MRRGVWFICTAWTGYWLTESWRASHAATRRRFFNLAAEDMARSNRHVFRSIIQHRKGLQMKTGHKIQFTSISILIISVLCTVSTKTTAECFIRSLQPCSAPPQFPSCEDFCETAQDCETRVGEYRNLISKCSEGAPGKTAKLLGSYPCTSFWVCDSVEGFPGAPCDPPQSGKGMCQPDIYYGWGLYTETACTLDRNLAIAPDWAQGQVMSKDSAARFALLLIAVCVFAPSCEAGRNESTITYENRN